MLKPMLGTRYIYGFFTIVFRIYKISADHTYQLFCQVIIIDQTELLFYFVFLKNSWISPECFNIDQIDCSLAKMRKNI